MKKRPFWIIYHSVDCEGYTTYMDYIGRNYEAAWSRFLFLGELIKRQYFTNHGVEPVSDIFAPNDAPKEWGKEIGHVVNRYLNDDCECWVSVVLCCVETDSFISAYVPRHGNWAQPTIGTDYSAEEERNYKNSYPNSKY